MHVAATFCLLSFFAACGGKVVFDEDGYSGDGGTGARGAGAAGTGAMGTGASGADANCVPLTDTTPDGLVDLEGPAPLATAEAYPLLRAVHANKPEGERFDIEVEGTVVAVEAVLFADDDEGDVVADVYYLCSGARQIAASARVPKVELPDYDGIHSELWTTSFEFDTPLPIVPGTTFDVLFRPEGVSVVAAVRADVYADGEMVGLGADDLSTLGDFAVQLVVD